MLRLTIASRSSSSGARSCVVRSEASASVTGFTPYLLRSSAFLSGFATAALLHLVAPSSAILHLRVFGGIRQYGVHRIIRSPLIPVASDLVAASDPLRTLSDYRHASFMKVCYKYPSPEIATGRPVTERQVRALARRRWIWNRYTGSAGRGLL